MSALALQKYETPDDPSTLGWPMLFPVEIALRVAPIKEICEAHNISHQEWQALRQNPEFVQALANYVKMIKEDGGASFRLKARLQAEGLLPTSWNLIHGVDTPANVKADLIKTTIRVAGLDASIEQKAAAMGGGGGNNAFQININLGKD